MKKQTSLTETIWRLIKVLYFFVTIPIVIWLVVFLMFSYESGTISNILLVKDFYLGVVYGLLTILGYILLTDIFRRVISYVSKGEWVGAFSYRALFGEHKKTFLPAFSIFLFILCILLIGNYWIKNYYCNGEGEQINSDGVCGCFGGYLETDGECVPKLRVEFETGAVIKFTKAPTQDDIEEAFINVRWHQKSELNGFVPLSKEDYQKAKESGLSFDQIVEMEKHRKNKEDMMHILAITTPEMFSKMMIAKYPDGVASDGKRYDAIPPLEFAKRSIEKNLTSVTKSGNAYTYSYPTPDVFTKKQVEETIVFLENFGIPQNLIQEWLDTNPKNLDGTYTIRKS